MKLWAYNGKSIRIQNYVSIMNLIIKIEKKKW
jgi:hypothetical protein